MTLRVWFRFDSGAATDIGRVRDHNEDSFMVLPGSGVWVVADGMGGHDAGDVAAAMIAEEIESIGVPVSATDLRARATQRIGRAHDRISSHGHALGHVTVGATIAALLIFETGFTCLWAGDSRIYLLRRGRLTRLTTDHSEVQELIEAGHLTEQQARSWPRKNIITRAIGIHGDPNFDTVTGMVLPGDVFLLCTDGLTEHHLDDELEQALLRVSIEGAQAVADQLIAQTLDRGAQDNVTAAIVHCIPMPDRYEDGP